MKAIKQAVVGAVVLLVVASANQTFAIEGLQVSVQSSNAIVSWPSTNTETFIVQYRSNLTASSSWQTLTNYFPASESNMTLLMNMETCGSVSERFESSQRKDSNEKLSKSVFGLCLSPGVGKRFSENYLASARRGVSARISIALNIRRFNLSKLK
jgi:hypothetical protein